MTPLPAVPNRGDPRGFAATGNNFVAALPRFVTEANALQADVTAKQITASAAAGFASVSSAAAEASASAAASGAATATSAASSASASAVEAANLEAQARYIAQQITIDGPGGIVGMTGYKANLMNSTGTITNWLTAETTSSRTWTLPDSDGVVAMVSSSPAVGKSPVGATNGMFSGAWVDPATDISAYNISVGGADTRYNSRLLTPVGSLGLTPVQVAQYGIRGTMSLSYEGCFGWYTSTGHNSTSHATGFQLHLRASDIGSGTETPDLLSIDGLGKMCVPGGVGLNTGVYAFGSLLQLGAAYSFAQDINSGYMGSGWIGNTSAPVRSIVNQVPVRQVCDSAAGAFYWQISPETNGAAGAAFSLTERMRLDSSGNLLVGASSGSSHYIVKQTGQGNPVLTIGGYPTTADYSLSVHAVSAGGASTTDCAINVRKNSVTGRSINAAGTINAGGADHAEYMRKADGCGLIAKGQVVGIDTYGHVTDKWATAISFAVKTTNPSYVGGDIWCREDVVGTRPDTPIRTPDETEQRLVSDAIAATDTTPAIEAVYETVVITPGDTDQEWAAKEADHAASLAAFNAALEAARQTVDRVAIAGQVPVNVLGATPGQYIVPVQSGDGITGIAMSESDMTLVQYMRAVGKVIATESDGRARIIVKVA